MARPGPQRQCRPIFDLYRGRDVTVEEVNGRCASRRNGQCRVSLAYDAEQKVSV